MLLFWLWLVFHFISRKIIIVIKWGYSYSNGVCIVICLLSYQIFRPTYCEVIIECHGLGNPMVLVKIKKIVIQCANDTSHTSIKGMQKLFQLSCRRGIWMQITWPVKQTYWKHILSLRSFHSINMLSWDGWT